MTAAVMIAGSCAGSEGRQAPSAVSAQTDAASQTAVSTTALNELDNETDWENMADIEEIDYAALKSNETSRFLQYIPSKEFLQRNQKVFSFQQSLCTFRMARYMDFLVRTVREKPLPKR